MDGGGGGGGAAAAAVNSKATAAQQRRHTGRSGVRGNYTTNTLLVRVVREQAGSGVEKGGSSL